MRTAGDILKVGYWTYGGAVRCRVEIQFSDIRYGSGDPQDSPEWQEDQAGDWFVEAYSSPTDPDNCPPNWKYGQGYPTLKEAVSNVETILCRCNLRWET